MSPTGIYDKRAQPRSLGSRLLYNVNQGVVPKGAAVDEQLARLDEKAWFPDNDPFPEALVGRHKAQLFWLEWQERIQSQIIFVTSSVIPT